MNGNTFLVFSPTKSQSDNKKRKKQDFSVKNTAQCTSRREVHCAPKSRKSSQSLTCFLSSLCGAIKMDNNTCIFLDCLAPPDSLFLGQFKQSRSGEGPTRAGPKNLSSEMASVKFRIRILVGILVGRRGLRANY